MNIEELREVVVEALMSYYGGILLTAPEPELRQLSEETWQQMEETITDFDW